MSRFWSKLTGTSSQPNEEAVAKLEEGQKDLLDAHSRSVEVQRLSSYLAARRKQNHFGDALTISFTPRSNHA